ncbi:hypothetical protein SDC9_14981 [bioreactor metagenome]|uniref:DUF445 domain-containing protein n=1 Tax=bioreactor metagenome TaxID=1076179 RepID=A0A644TQN9_9ZZZZ|nr:DUF445 domain-containing protein [Negativicutes bacterium]
MKSNKHKATVTLGIVSAGFLASYPFSNTFWGGLLTSGCQAGMVGGMADWFAVTALFKKPLGIPFRTALISRNRDRIFTALMDMVENELITKENIIRELAKYDFAGFLIQYLDEHGGKEDIKAIVRKIGVDVLEQVEPGEFGQMIDRLLKTNAGRVKVAPFAVQAVEWSVRTGYADKFVDFILDEMIRLAGHQHMRTELVKIISQAKQAYEHEMAGRQLVSALLDLSSDSLAVTAQTKLTEFLGELKNPSHPLRERIQKWLEDLAESLKTDAAFQERVEDWKSAFFSKLDSAALIAELVDGMRYAGNHSVSGLLRLSRWFGYKFDNLIADFKVNPTQQENVDSALKQLINRLVEKHHHQIGLTVKAALDKYSNERLVEFVESKAGNDLQMIRINGSVVGSLVGMLIFLVTYWL